MTMPQSSIVSDIEVSREAYLTMHLLFKNITRLLNQDGLGSYGAIPVMFKPDQFWYQRLRHR